MMQDLFQDETITLEEQIRCVTREIRMRVKVYKHMVQRGQMSEKTAEQEIRTMQAVEETLKRLRSS